MPATKGGFPGGGRNGKFNAAGRHVAGVWCASDAEAERYEQLLALEAKGTIGNLRTQVPTDLTVNNQLICRYRCDFAYDVLDDHGRQMRSVIEDVKGMVTPEFKLKHKLFDALSPVPLTLIKVKGKAKHPGRPGEKASSAGWMNLHWKGRIPDPH